MHVGVHSPQRPDLIMKLPGTPYWLVIALFCFTEARAEWVNSLKPVGKAAGHITVAKAGKPRGAIQIPARPTPQETNAAAQLQLWLKEITGATLPVTARDVKGSRFSIRTDASLGDEGYDISVKRGGIVLAGGRTRGVMNAVYALLEEDLGCRFYAGDSIRLPRTNTLVIAPVARRYAPRLKIRDPFYACAFDPAWSLRNRANAPSAVVPEEQGGHVDYDGMFVHTAAQMVPADKYFKEHPDYFALQADGKRTPAQLCATHPDVVKIAIDYVRKVLRENPHAEILSVSKNDVQLSCLCERCKKLRDAEGSDMANQLFLVNQVAEAIEAEHPDVLIDTLAYLETIQVPKTVRPRGNVAIRLCNDSVGAWSHPFTPAAQCDVAKLAGAWGAVHPRIYIWDYNVNFSHYLAPMPNLDVMAANIRFWITNNAEGVMLQGGYQGAAEQDQYKSWVTAKLMWNPAWDEKALERDFIEGHYGKAAPAIYDYETLLQELRTNYAKEMASPAGGIRYPMDAPFLTKDFVTRATDIFARARTLAAGDTALLRRIDRAELPILYVQCARGPEFTGATYAQVVADFERIARAEKVQYLQEGDADFETKLASYKARLPKAAPASK
jgi:hypothetical protein